jgi:hypothetical protein
MLRDGTTIWFAAHADSYRSHREFSCVIPFTKESDISVMFDLTGRVLKFIVLNTKEI